MYSGTVNVKVTQYKHNVVQLLKDYFKVTYVNKTEKIFSFTHVDKTS